MPATTLRSRCVCRNANGSKKGLLSFLKIFYISIRLLANSAIDVSKKAVPQLSETSSTNMLFICFQMPGLLDVMRWYFCFCSSQVFMQCNSISVHLKVRIPIVLQHLKFSHGGDIFLFYSFIFKFSVTYSKFNLKHSQN